MLAALAFDVVPNHARAQQAAARAATGWRRALVRIIEHMRPARRRLRRGMLMRRLPPRDRLTLQDVTRRIGSERIGYLDNHLAFAVWAKALLASVLIFDFERMPVGTFALNSHVRPASRTVEDLEEETELDANCSESLVK
jgi:hypothetical protein